MNRGVRPGTVVIGDHGPVPAQPEPVYENMCGGKEFIGSDTRIHRRATTPVVERPEEE